LETYVNSPVKDVIDYLQSVAGQHGLVLNPNDNALNRLANSLGDSLRKNGAYFCPCKQHYPIDKQRDPTCPCPTFLTEIKQNGSCDCHLFFDIDTATRNRERLGLLATVTCPG
jgi:ferredoxin-thioredoxin reductase catalytic subunit